MTPQEARALVAALPAAREHWLTKTVEGMQARAVWLTGSRPAGRPVGDWYLWPSHDRPRVTRGCCTGTGTREQPVSASHWTASAAAARVRARTGTPSPWR